MADINIEEIVIGFLDANKPTGWQVLGDMPKSRPAAFILVDRTGGSRENIVQDRAEILIEVYHKTSRETASDQANVIADIVKNLEVLEPVMKAKVNSLVKLDDLLGQYWRYQIYCDVYYRRDVATGDIIYPVIPTGSPVTSVNGKIGAVVLNAADVGADASGAAAAALAAAEAYTDEQIALHPGVADTAWTEIDWTNKFFNLFGGVPLSLGTAGNATVRMKRVGRAVYIKGTINFDYDHDTGAIVVMDYELPYAPLIPDGVQNLAYVSEFGYAVFPETSFGAGDGRLEPLGPVISYFGGPAGFLFTQSSRNNQDGGSGNIFLTNYPFDGTGRRFSIVFALNYEAAAAA